VRIILDENLWPELAAALNAFEPRYNLTFLHINEIAPGAQDEDIPKICRRHGAAALVSENVRDFGARRVIFEALLGAGVSMIVPRPSKRGADPRSADVHAYSAHTEDRCCLAWRTGPAIAETHRGRRHGDQSRAAHKGSGITRGGGTLCD
jgi:hypothetical protein